MYNGERPEVNKWAETKMRRISKVKGNFSVVKG